MLELELSYNNKTSFLLDQLNLKYPEFKITAYNVDNLEEFKNAMRLQTYWATTITPFLIISENGEPKKGFYEESKECNIGKIDEWINNYLDGKK